MTIHLFSHPTEQPEEVLVLCGKIVGTNEIVQNANQYFDCIECQQEVDRAYKQMEEEAYAQMQAEYEAEYWNRAQNEYYEEMKRIYGEDFNG